MFIEIFVALLIAKIIFATDAAEEFRKRGNQFFKERKFLLAAEEYSKGIDLENVSRQLLTLLHSNRCVSRLEFNDLNGAKNDAKGCVILRPKWFQGYARLGTAYMKLDKLDKAIENLSIADGLGDASKSTTESLEFCKNMRTKTEGRDHIDADILGRGLCQLGHRYFEGVDGVPQDYERAVHYFAQAAALGDATGLFNMSLAMREGKGVAEDEVKGHILLLRAASKEPTMGSLKCSGLRVQNIGVIAAYHQLGLAYEKGEAVTVHREKAMEWYQKALEFGYAKSANRIASIHYSCNKDIEKALDYWRLSAHLGSVEAMESIAVHYRDCKDRSDPRVFDLMMMWHIFAMYNSRMDLIEKMNLSLICPFMNMKDIEEIATLLEKDVRASSLGPLLLRIETFQASIVNV